MAATPKPYAANTKVSASRTREDIEKLLKTHGATGFGYINHSDVTLIAFILEGRHYRMMLSLPDVAGLPFEDIERAERRRKHGREDAVQSVYEQEEQRRWRALFLVLKAKLVAVADHIRTLEEEFLADEVMPNNQRFGEWAEPQLQAMRKRGMMPPILPGVHAQLKARLETIEGEYHIDE
jgi:hypothetical protein